MTKQNSEPMGWLHPNLNLHRAWQGRRVLRWRTQLFLAALAGLCIFAIWIDKPIFLIFSVLAFFAPISIAPKSLQKKQSLLEIEKNYGQAYTTALVINHNNFGFGTRLEQQAEAIQKQAQLPSLPVAEMLLALALVALFFAIPKQSNIQTAKIFKDQVLPTETQNTKSRPQTTNSQNQTGTTNQEQPQNLGNQETSKEPGDLQNATSKTPTSTSGQNSAPRNNAISQKNKKTSSTNSPIDSQTNDAKNNTEKNPSNNQSTESLSRDFLQQQAKKSAQNKKPNGDDGQNKQSGNTQSSSGQNKNSQKNDAGNNSSGNTAAERASKTKKQKQAEQQKRNAQENPQQAPSSGQGRSNGQTPIGNPQKSSAEKNSAKQNNQTSQSTRDRGRNLGAENEDVARNQPSNSGQSNNNPNTKPGKATTTGQNSSAGIPAKPSSGSTKIERLPGQIGNGAASSGNTELPGNATAFEASPSSQAFKRAAEDAILDPRLPPEYQELLRRYYK